MSPADLGVAQALVTHPRWEWRAGMVALVSRPDGSRVPVRVLAWDTHAVAGVGARPMPSGRWEQAPAYSDDVPDLNDPGTVGCLLTALWEVDPGAMLRRDPHRAPGADPFTVALTVSGAGRADGPTPGVALARALLATWSTP